MGCTKMKQKKVYLTVGIPASGKSTFIRNRINQYGGVCISRDEVRFSMLKDGEEYAYVTLRERSITVFESQRSDKSEKYYLWDPVDWDYIETLLKTAE